MSNLNCDKCGASIMPESHFCSQCGDAVTADDQKTVILAGQAVVSAEICFGYSSASTYEKAVSICSKLPSYSVKGEGKKIQHKVVLPITEVELIANIFDLVGSWKSAQMMIDGQVATKKNLTYYGIGCYRNRQKSFNPAAFCFGDRQLDANIWGCKKLGLPLLEWGGGWFEYGRFDDKGAWHLDKERIRFDLEVALKENAWCPVLNRARVLKTLDKLPAVIDPKTNSNWKYRTSHEAFGDGFRQVAVGIQPVFNKASSYVVGDFKPEWQDATPPETKPTEIVLKVAVPSKISPLTKTTNPPEGTNNLGKIIIVIFVLLFLFRYLFGGLF